MVDTTESVGSGIARTGSYELPVTEALWRLSEPSDTALDVGANIGYFTALLGARCRSVRAFEPHPVLHERVAANAARWHKDIQLDRRALSDRAGTAQLSNPANFAQNRGTASLRAMRGAVGVIDVQTTTLDDIIDGARIGVMKIDVEGHEASVLAGGEQSLSEGLIRDIVFEEHEPLPTPVSRALDAHGFTIFGLTERVAGITLTKPSATAAPRWHAPTYLATTDPDRARALFRRRGWHSLRRSARRR